MAIFGAIFLILVSAVYCAGIFIMCCVLSVAYVVRANRLTIWAADFISNRVDELVDTLYGVAEEADNRILSKNKKSEKSGS